MGNLIGDGKSVDVTVPAGVYSHGDLYRIGGWTGFLINDCPSAATDRKRAMEVAYNRIWSAKMPSGLTVVAGALYSWSTGTGDKRGDTDLVANATAGSQGPVVKALTAKNANGYAQVMLVGQGSEAHA